MKKTLALLLIFCYVGIYFSQTDSTSVKNNISFIAYWSKGDSYDFKVTKIKQQIKEGKIVKNSKNEYISNFTVIDSTANSYIISWKFENDLGNTFKIPEELTKKLSKYEFTEIKYKTSELGEFQEILNWEEVSEISKNMINDIINVLGKDDDKLKAVLSKTMNGFKDLYSSKQGVEQLILKELQYFHYPLGYEFNPKETLTYEDELPNMFGGKPLKGNGKLYFEEVDYEEGFCVMKQDLDIDSKDAIEFLKSLFIKLKLDNKDMEKALKNATFNISDRNVYEYYFNPGIPHKIETLRESIIDIDNEKGKRIDKVIIELQYSEE